MKTLNIVTRKARDNFNEYVVVDRGQAYENERRYVSATANRISIAGGEWFWGHYFCTLDQAVEHFDGR